VAVTIPGLDDAAIARITPDEWWELLGRAPKVAGPWAPSYYEEQRVRTIMERRCARHHGWYLNGHDDDARLISVTGPHHHIMEREENQVARWWLIDVRGGPLWYLTGTGWYESLVAAQQAADRLLREHGWLLAGPAPREEPAP
jgi:hypothetical protein